MYDEEEYVTKETIICDKCQHTMITDVKKGTQKAHPHMLYISDASWLLLKTEAAAFNKPLGKFITFLIHNYRAHKENFSVPPVEIVHE